MPIPRVATVDYLNARPLVWGFTHGSRSGAVSLLHGTPARCAEYLSAGEVDVALIPSIEYLRIPGLTVLPGMCIASRRQARSVLLVSRVAAAEIRSVALDTSSRTSAALLKILLERRSRHRVRYHEMEPHLHRMLETCEAALLIGDAALQSRTDGLKVYDLAAEWHAMTGLPFVFAFWAVRPGANLPSLTQPFLDSKNQGLAQRESIAQEAASELGLPAAHLCDYLRSNIYYDLGEEEIRALWLFYRLARESALVETARELTLHESGMRSAGGAEWAGAR
ncbi:MAG: menaquinone biosynthesis protein [Acidobacteria bacterium]|nr:menaquinone biosynthesis protein [Acidobacteriota bacterium]